MSDDDCDEFYQKIERARGEREWIGLDSALFYTLEWLVGREPSSDEEWDEVFHLLDRPENPSTDFGIRYWRAARLGEKYLIGLLADGAVRSRGVLHQGADSLTAIDLSASVWWRRWVPMAVYKRHFVVNPDPLPIHLVNWDRRSIARCDPLKWRTTRGLGPQLPEAMKGLELHCIFGEHPEAHVLAMVTDVEVHREELLKIVTPPGGLNSAQVEAPRRRQRRAARTRAAEAQRAANIVVARRQGDQVVAISWGPLAPKDMIDSWFNSQRAFVLEVLQELGNSAPSESDVRRITRYLFEVEILSE